ncbi:MAG: T9SS type A sorting domain-containing protein [Saprospiraceae bacterium]|nr:T9SS type A sorting domain-containing protein [Saprospiraceae bacterium]
MTSLKAIILFYLQNLLIFFLVSDITAQQLLEVPLDNNPVIIRHHELHPQDYSRNNQVCPVDTLTIPFFEDFSSDTSFYPNCSKWQDNHVFVNFDMAYNPPSIGVATFEGLASDGKPYNTGASVTLGTPADTLTSQHIDLSGKSASDAIFLSFFYQKQGLSDRPEEQDSFILEFKDTSNTWQRVWEQEGVNALVSSLTLIDFEQQYIAINSADFLYNGFQFRFRNLASVSGNNDHWHLDYILLDEGRANNADTLNSNYGRYADVAFTHRPTTPLKNNYSAMPWRHFKDSSMFADTIVICNFNHNDSTGIATLDRSYRVDQITPNPTSLTIEGIPAIPSYFPSSNDDDCVSHPLINPFNSSFVPVEKTILESTYTILSPSGFQNNPMFFDNDTVVTQTVLDNYFAYDDGTAETRVIAQGLGTKVAVEFTAEVSDTLQGIYFHLPYFTNRDAQLDFINVKVWLDSLTGPEAFSRDLHHLQYSNGFNGFYFVDLVDFAGVKYLIPLQPGQKFYIGWQQSFGPEVPVGFDRSTDASNKTFIGTGTVWDTSSLKGSVMIRPLLWPDSNFTLIPIKNLNNIINELTIYPNPTKDLLNLKLTDYTNSAKYIVLIHNSMGQEIYTAQFKEQLSLNNWQTGLYLLTLYDENGNILSQKKIIKN